MPTNKPLPFDSGLIESIRVDPWAAQRRASEIGTRRTFKGASQVAATIRAIRCMDLTTLAGDDTLGRVDRLCAKARRPVDLDLQTALVAKFDLPTTPICVGAVCVYHKMVADAAAYLAGSNIPVAAVSTGFPAGQTPLETKLKEIELSIGDGATEIDIVISRALALTERWRELYDEVVACRAACGERAKLKVILGIGNLGRLETVAKAAMVAMLAGADTIKTSTGYEPTNATPEGALVMVRMIRRFHDLTKIKVGFKPAGGIKTAADAWKYFILMKEELGDEWTQPELLRLGASSLLADLELQLNHQAFGRYGAESRFAVA